jgi:hypothetical protein
VDAHVKLVAVGLSVWLHCFEPRVGFVVFKVAVEAFEETLAPLLSVGALEHVVVGLLVLATWAEVAGGPPLLVQAVESG